MMINRAPDFQRPVLVELVRVLKEKRVVDVQRVVSALTHADGSRIDLGIFWQTERGHDLLLANAYVWRNFFGFRARSCRLNDIFHLQLFERRQQTDWMFEINSSSDIWIVIKLVSGFNPHRLPIKSVLGRLQVVCVQLRGNYIIVSTEIGIGDSFWSRSRCVPSAVDEK